MTTQLRRTLAIAAAAMTLASGTALAQGKSHEKAKNEKHGRKNDVVRVESRGNVAVPPGLAKKPGGMPPGQYKKLYPTQGASVLRDVFIRHGYTVVRTTPYGESQYVYYRLPNGTVQRAIVAPGTSRLSFSNVPASLLQEVLSLLY